MDRDDFEQDVRLRTIPNLLDFAARTHGDRPFLRESGAATFLSFAEAARSARTLADLLGRLGVSRGDHVPIMLPNGTLFVLAWFAVNLRAATYVGVNTSLVGELLARQLSIGQPRLWVVHADYLPVLAALPEAVRSNVETLVVAGLGDEAEAPAWCQVVRWEALATEAQSAADAARGPEAVSWNEICALGFTSGTTGPSKAVMVPHSQAVTSAIAFARIVALGPDDVLYTPLPLFHGMSSRMGMLPALLTGCAVVLGKRFSGSKFWAEAIEAQATVAQIIFSVPGILMAQPSGPQDRRHRVTRMFNAHHSAEFERRFGVQLIEAFAMSEIGLVIASPLEERRPGSAGRSQPGWEVAIVDEDGMPVPVGVAGEIVCRPQSPGLMMRGYLGQPDRTLETLRDLWFHTGDIATKDADGYVWFLDRMKERIRRRGENISSMEIEDGARHHPDVEDAAAVAHPARAGEDDIRLLVVPRTGCCLTGAEVHAWLSANMPRFMVARYIEIVPALPYTATNKVEKAKLIAAGLGAGAWDAEAAMALTGS